MAHTQLQLYEINLRTLAQWNVERCKDNELQMIQQAMDQPSTSAVPAAPTLHHVPVQLHRSADELLPFKESMETLAEEAPQIKPPAAPEGPTHHCLEETKEGEGRWHRPAPEGPKTIYM